MKKLKGKFAALAGFAVLTAGLLVFNPGNFISRLLAEEVPPLGAAAPPVKVADGARVLNNQMMEVSKAVLPTVVSVSVEIDYGSKNKSKNNNDEEDYGGNEDFRDFFRFFGQPFGGDEPENYGKGHGSGSGVLISTNGYIVTNNHVVENATEKGITVTLNDKREFKARLVGADPLTDLAVIKIEANNLPTAHLGNMDQVQVGEMVFAVGSPLGLNSTVTQGIVSAIGRGQIGSLRRDPKSVENYIQTDAAINPGNSGGGLFDIEGSLIGINAAIATGTGSFIGYGFAIPIDIVRSVITDLIDDGKVNRGYIGVQIKPVTPDVAGNIGLPNTYGALVVDRVKGSPAEKADIQSGDVILEVDGKQIRASNELQGQIVLYRPGDKVNLTIWRDGKRINKTVTLEVPKDDVAASEETVTPGEESEKPNPASFDKLGFSVIPLDKDAKKKFDTDEGVYVQNVKRGSEAYQKGLSSNGVIVKADRQQIKSVEQLKKLIEGKKSGETILLNIKYANNRDIVALEVP
ncbi:MAG: Do family serine endopeptidase [Chloroflexota bacterium]